MQISEVCVILHNMLISMHEQGLFNEDQKEEPNVEIISEIFREDGGSGADLQTHKSVGHVDLDMAGVIESTITSQAEFSRFKDDMLSYYEDC